MKFLPQVFPITSFGDGGFRFGSHSHLGSLMVLPSGMRAWSNGEVLQASDFSLLIVEKENIDFVIFGTGKEMARPPREVSSLFSNEDINMEFMSTSSAVHTYNVMLAERRRIAACLMAVT